MPSGLSLLILPSAFANESVTSVLSSDELEVRHLPWRTSLTYVLNFGEPNDRLSRPASVLALELYPP